MWKTLYACLWALLGAGACQAAELSALEQRWLQGIAPVVAFARLTHFPLDIVVQPQPTPGLTPMGMAFDDGRCTLVLSMRENPLVQELLDQIEPDLFDATLELMAAHELGHCERYLSGQFARLPAGFGAGASGPDSGEGSQAQHLQVVQREEGFADIVGLAWTQHRHPELYAALHAWLSAKRGADESRGSAHDTTPWLQLVRDGAVLADPALFVNAAVVWRRGLIGLAL